MKVKALCAVLVPAVVVGGYCLWPSDPSVDQLARPANAAEGAKAWGDAPGSASAASTVPAESIDLPTAVQQKSIVAEFTSNGHNRFSVIALNKSDAPLRITVPVGQAFEGDHSTVIVIRPAEMTVQPGKTAEFPVQIAAVRSSNKIGTSAYSISYQSVPRVELLLTFLQDRPELSNAAIQTAILALTDNLPLSAVAKFTMAGGALPSRFNTDAYRVETVDIIAALNALRELGVKDFQLAMTIDPQLRIESMIDPQTRAAAMHYYGIEPEREWDFWKNELLQGEPTTRHYALYGIARFYPEIALEMLPRWVRETRTNPVYRLSAAQALADTQKPEALPILRQLIAELGPTTELGKAANTAAEYLDYRLAQLASSKNAVAFRTSDKDKDVQF